MAEAWGYPRELGEMPDPRSASRASDSLPAPGKAHPTFRGSRPPRAQEGPLDEWGYPRELAEHAPVIVRRPATPQVTAAKRPSAQSERLAAWGYPPELSA